MRFLRSLVGVFVLSVGLGACKGDEGDTGPRESEPDPSMGGSPSELGEATDVPCDSDRECSDGAFCNGEETCYEGFCYLGLAPRCDDGIACTTDRCSHVENRCLFEPPDEDGDGHADMHCSGPDGEILGDDCDDSDFDRFPGNIERCSFADPTHDEDCDPETFGHLDEDQDGAISAACCNESEGGKSTCGDDCDDDNFRRYPEHPEICDDIDNDCDGEVDVNTKEVPWYPDGDGDHYGTLGSESVLSCAPVEGHALRATDCDDDAAAIHSAALEICDGFDNDCDGDVDEDGVCACAPNGNVRACACSDKATGVQSCSAGLWGSCDCTQCISGTVDCLGALLPRICVAGRWAVQNSCKGVRPLCENGACVCADGTTDCVDVPDLVPPGVVATSPGALARGALATAPIAVVFNEDMASGSFAGHVILADWDNAPVSGTVAVGGNTMLFTPDAPLHPGADYTLAVSTMVTDLAGNGLLVPLEIRFGVAPAYEPVVLTPSGGGSYARPVLDISPAGAVMALVWKLTEFSIDGDVAELTYAGSAWSEVGNVWPEDSSPDLVVDDTNQAMALSNLGTTINYYDKPSTTWSAVTELTTVHMSGVKPLLALSGSGYGFYATAVSNTWRVQPRLPNGSYPATVEMIGIPGATSFREATVGEGGHGIIAFDVDGVFLVNRSGSALASPWLQAQTKGSASDPVLQAATCMDSTGVATVAWVQMVEIALQPFPQLFIQDLDASGAWVGSAARALPVPEGRNELYPELGVDAADMRHMVYTVNETSVRASRRAPAGSWLPEETISAPFADPVQGLTLRVAPDGHAVVVWLQQTGSLDLWAARYTPGTGWGTAGRLEESDAPVSEFTFDILPTGEALVLFMQNDLMATRF